MSAFDSCYLKLARADYHLKTIEDRLKEWSQSKPYSITKRTAPDGSWHSVRIIINKELEFEELSLIAGDCVHNMRSALDHSIYALAVVGNPDPPDERKLAFPICGTPDAFRDQIRRGRLNGINSRIQAQIACLQPYRRKHALAPPLLALLRDLDDRDKHRLLHLAYSRPVGQGLEEFKCDDAGHRVHQLVEVIPHNGAIINGTDIVLFRLHPPCLRIQYKFDATLAVCIDHDRGPTGLTANPAYELLEMAGNEVSFIIDTLSGLK